MNRHLSLGLLGLSLLSLCACSSAPKLPAPVAETPPPPPAVAAAPAPAPAPKPVAVAAPPLPDYLDPSSPVYQQRSVFFDFDSFAVRADQQAAIETQGRYLAAHPELHVRIEGNTDERGGAEYNLALGQHRAEAVQKALSIMGVKAGQMEAVSLGKEKPRASGHDEAAWAQNRRADVAYPAR